MDATKKQLEGEILPDLRKNITYTFSLHTGIITLLPSLGKEKNKIYISTIIHIYIHKTQNQKKN